jgi:anti-anti-sigma factor
VAGEVVLIVSGEIDLLSAPEFEAALLAADHTESALVVDLSGISYLDSTGLRVLMVFNQKRGAGRQVHVRAASEQVRKVMALTGLDTSTTIADP